MSLDKAAWTMFKLADGIESRCRHILPSTAKTRQGGRLMNYFMSGVITATKKERRKEKCLKEKMVSKDEDLPSVV